MENLLAALSNDPVPHRLKYIAFPTFLFVRSTEKPTIPGQKKKKKIVREVSVHSKMFDIEKRKSD